MKSRPRIMASVMAGMMDSVIDTGMMITIAL
jgi:hypothetical protein